MSRRAGLSELMGSKGAAEGGNLRLEHLPQILGDLMPELPQNAVGRHRLVSALSQRFGPNFRTLPGVKGLVDEFDENIKHAQLAARLRAIKPAVKKEK